MKKFNCDFLRLAVEFDEANINKEKLLYDLESEDKEANMFVISLGSKNKRKKEHAHLQIVLDNKNSFFRLEFIPTIHGGEEYRTPYIEDVHKWLGELFPEKAVADLMAAFKFGNDYESEIQVNYPLHSTNDLLNNVEIVGHDMKFPSEALIHRANISSNGKDITVMLYSLLNLHLKDFELYQSIEVFSNYANALVKKKEDKK